MAWRKSSPGLIALFDAVAPIPPAERRNMFGYPSAFVNGQLFMGLFEESMSLRLAEPDRQAFLALPDAAPFEPMAGRPMREYVTVPPAMLVDGPELRGWIAKSLAYARSLPPKAPKGAKPKRAVAKGTTTKRAAAKRPTREAGGAKRSTTRSAKPRRAAPAKVARLAPARRTARTASAIKTRRPAGVKPRRAGAARGTGAEPKRAR